MELIPGKSGVFDVSVDGKTIFSKRQSVRFPNADELVATLKSLRQQGG